MIKYYMAPLEGITTRIFRQVYHRHYPDFDRYFTPFLTSVNLSNRERQEILPDNNVGMELIPQILTNRVDVFLAIADQLKDYGYSTVNLNLGCPSGTVVAKKRGAGQLRDTYALESFLDELFSKSPLKISIKTRLGMCDESEWEDVLELYQKYPLEELIIHPRLRDDWYKGSPRLNAYDMAVGAKLSYPLCYNGNITSPETDKLIRERFPDTDRIMIGRGIVTDPGLLGRIKDNSDGVTAAEYLTEEYSYARSPEELDELKDFLEDLLDSYRADFGQAEERNLLFKLKDVWNFLGLSFPGLEREVKAIKKADSVGEMKIAVSKLLTAAK